MTTDPFHHAKFEITSVFMSKQHSDADMLEYLEELSGFIDNMIITFEDAIYERNK